MSSPESRQPTSEEILREQRLGRLTVIRAIMSFEDDLETAQAYAKTFGGARIAPTHSILNPRIQGALMGGINEALAYVGGIPTTIETPHGQNLVALTEWHGRHDENPNLHVWDAVYLNIRAPFGRPIFTPRQFLSEGLEAIQTALAAESPAPPYA